MTRAVRRCGLGGGIAGLLLVCAASPVFGTSVKLSNESPDYGTVAGFQVPDSGSWIVYAQQRAAQIAQDLFSVPAGGGDSVELVDGDFVDYLVSPQGSRLVFIRHVGPSIAMQLYSVPITGPMAATVPITAPLSELETVEYLAVTSDDSRVVYTVYDNQTRALYSTSILGPPGSEVMLHPPADPSALGVLFPFELTPDGSRVVYLMEDAAQVTRLFSIPVAGPVGERVRLDSGADYIFRYRIAEDGSRVVYGVQLNGVGNRLYSVPVAGPAGASVSLIPDVAPPRGVSSFEVTPDGLWAVYISDQDVDNVFELYSVPTDGSQTVAKLNGALAEGGLLGRFEISPDSSRVVYFAERETAGVRELYSVPIAGPASNGVKLNGPLLTSEVLDFEISPDSRWVVYVAYQDFTDTPFGYRAPLAGPQGADEGIWSVPDMGVPNSHYTIGPRSQQVVVNAGWAWVDPQRRLWSCKLAGRPDFSGQMLSDPPVSGGEVYDFAVAGGRWVVYRGDIEVAGTAELYSIVLPILFRDDFESGNASHWSSMRPVAFASSTSP